MIENLWIFGVFRKKYAAVIPGLRGRLWADGADAQTLKTAIRIVI